MFARTTTIAAALIAATVWQGAGAQTPAGGADCALEPQSIHRESASRVVRVVGVGIDPMRVMDRVRFGSGTGIVLGEGLVLTNLHVVAGASEIVAIHEGNAWPAELAGRDAVLDLAVLRAPGLIFSAEALPMAPADPVPGDTAYVVGYPLGLGQSITAGMVSGIDRFLPLNTSSWMTRYIQTDAPVSPGNSGGPLLDRCGRLIGLVTLKSLHPAAEDIGYALPVSEIARVLPELIETGEVRRPWHGLYGQMVSPLIQNLMGQSPIGRRGGFLVETVEPGSAADRAGLRGGTMPLMWGASEIILGGDVITGVNGRRLVTLEDAVAAVQALAIGEAVTISYLRDGEPREATLTIEARPVFESDLPPPGSGRDGYSK
ncbi:trypsin-like peptidase domain-containing protein [Limibaculum sp. FT325]|uniref:S1C family serine protease n=1 Tax=Thermohalobaculum sediminis TaxID=2939436 RepID=UPI0020C0312F|nr:trypsin-like peptidase domain-containing protein [Limibaculum sediminis]MCL5779005.1 trypsin-like peptidase domain-containing protein [Limibaculum sediminis]